jgi:hypothetical protein
MNSLFDLEAIIISIDVSENECESGCYLFNIHLHTENNEVYQLIFTSIDSIAQEFFDSLGVEFIGSLDGDFSSSVVGRKIGVVYDKNNDKIIEIKAIR